MFGVFDTTGSSSQRLEAHAFASVSFLYAKLEVYVLTRASQSFTKLLSEQRFVGPQPQEPQLFLGSVLPRLAELKDLLLTGEAFVLLSALRQTAFTHGKGVATGAGPVHRRESHQVVSAVLCGSVTSVFLEQVLANALFWLSSGRKVAEGSGCLSRVVLFAVSPNRSEVVLPGQRGEPLVTALDRASPSPLFSRKATARLNNNRLA